MYRTMRLRNDGPPVAIGEYGHHRALLVAMVGGASGLTLTLGAWLCGVLS